MNKLIMSLLVVSFSLSNAGVNEFLYAIPGLHILVTPEDARVIELTNKQKRLIEENELIKAEQITMKLSEATEAQRKRNNETPWYNLKRKTIILPPLVVVGALWAIAKAGLLGKGSQDD